MGRWKPNMIPAKALTDSRTVLLVDDDSSMLDLYSRRLTSQLAEKSTEQQGWRQRESELEQRLHLQRDDLAN